MRFRKLSILLTVGASWACAPMEMDLRRTLSEAEANQMGVMAKYRGSRVRVRGVVTTVAIHRQLAVDHSHEEGSDFTSRPRQEKLPYVYLVPGDGLGGRALCYFPPDDYVSAGQAKKDESLALDCDFQEYISRGKDRVIVLNSCRLVAQN